MDPPNSLCSFLGPFFRSAEFWTFFRSPHPGNFVASILGPLEPKTEGGGGGTRVKDEVAIWKISDDFIFLWALQFTNLALWVLAKGSSNPLKNRVIRESSPQSLSIGRYRALNHSAIPVSLGRSVTTKNGHKHWP